jgi:hypothetical protein
MDACVDCRLIGPIVFAAFVLDDSDLYGGFAEEKAGDEMSVRDDSFRKLGVAGAPRWT